MPITPLYNTKTFVDVWNKAETFKDDVLAADITISLVANDLKDLYYLLYSKYGNNPIANYDETQFKYKVYTTIYSYGAIWKKRKTVLNNLLNLTESDIINRGKSISNFASNPSSHTSAEIDYVDSQSVNKQEGNKILSYQNLLDSLDEEADKWFIDKFSICFTKFVNKNIESVYITDDDEQ